MISNAKPPQGAMTCVTGRKFSEWRGVSSASRVYSANGYEISDELQRKQVEVLERRYGGSSRAHHAATIIQRAYRKYRLDLRFKQMTQYPLRRIPPGVADEFSRCYVTRSTRTPSSLSVSPNNGHRYIPSTSLSAQLRADRASARASTEDRAPPSPSPATGSGCSSALNTSTSSSANRSMIDSLMSPRLVQRRFPPSQDNGVNGHNGYSNHNSNGGGPTTNHGIVWVPRNNLAQQNPNHSNSLPRLERHLVRDHPAACLPLSATTDQERRRQYRVALNYFNKTPDRGVYLLTHWHFVDDTPESVAKLLLGRRGLSKQQIGEYIGTLRSPFHESVRRKYIALLDLRGLEVDVALRKAIQMFILPKESEKIDKVLQAFAYHYCHCNPQRAATFHGRQESVYLLAFAIIMLNTDLHNPNVKLNRMKKEEFVRNLRGQDKFADSKQGYDFDRPYLEGIYERVQDDKFLPGDDHVAQVRRVEGSIMGKDKPRLVEDYRRLVCYCRMQQVIDPNKKQSVNSHDRDVFLFNDMIVVVKGIPRKRSSQASYTYKAHSTLLGATVQEYAKGQYDFGISLKNNRGERFYFNMRSGEDRRRFMADLLESIKESEQMEELRLILEMDKMHADNQRDSGLPDMDSTVVTNAPPSRRLSFNSLDSGVVEETFENT